MQYDLDLDFRLTTDALTNKRLSYDQLTGVPIRAPANWTESDSASIRFIENKPEIKQAVLCGDITLVMDLGDQFEVATQVLYTTAVNRESQHKCRYLR